MKRYKLFLILTILTMTISVFAGPVRRSPGRRGPPPPPPNRGQKAHPDRGPNPHREHGRDRDDRDRDRGLKDRGERHHSERERDRPFMGARGVQKGGWTMITEFSAGGEAKEVLLDRRATQCKIEVVSGTVIFNTIVIRRGGAKRNMVVSRRVGERQEVNIPVDRSVTGLRISDDGRGRYRVYYK